MLFLKQQVWKALEHLKVSAPLSLLRSSALVSEGWYRSYYAKQPVDNQGHAIPWYTYAAIHFLEERLKPTFRVFEYGCGNSTIWYSKRVSSVVAVEHDSDWVTRIAARTPPNALVIHQPLHNGYVEEITEHGIFDLVVIDGRRRPECGLLALQALGPQGVIVWDNSERQRYADAISRIRAAGFRQISFQGMMPIAAYSSQTSILYRPSNCLEI